MKTSIVFYPNLAKRSKKNGKIPIYLRICMKAKKCETRLNAELSEEQLLKWDPLLMRISDRNSLVNLQLNKIDDKFHQFLTIHATELPKYSPSYIKDFILGNDTSQQRSVLKFVNDYFTSTVINNINCRPGTIKNYRRSVNHFQSFLTSIKNENLAFNHLNFEVAQEFKNYLVSSNPHLGRVGMTEVSAAGIIKKFRTIFNHAVDRELLSKNPFKLIKIKTKSPKKERLTIKQVKSLWEVDLTNFQAQDLYRNLFLFGIFTGLAYQDMMSLTWNNLQRQNDDIIKLTIRRVKSDVFTESFLPDFAVRIALEYKSITRPDKSVFPRRSNKELNSQLKLLAYLTQIPIRMTSHTARHTYRQLLAEAGIEDYAVIRRMMGQTNANDMDDIYYSITESRLLEAKRKLDLYLISNLPNP